MNQDDQDEITYGQYKEIVAILNDIKGRSNNLKKSIENIENARTMDKQSYYQLMQGILERLSKLEIDMKKIGPLGVMGQ